MKAERLDDQRAGHVEEPTIEEPSPAGVAVTVTDHASVTYTSTISASA